MGDMEDTPRSSDHPIQGSRIVDVMGVLAEAFRQAEVVEEYYYPGDTMIREDEDGFTVWKARPDYPRVTDTYERRLARGNS